jgi:hypothetical protein
MTPQPATRHILLAEDNAAAEYGTLPSLAGGGA